MATARDPLSKMSLQPISGNLVRYFESYIYIFKMRTNYDYIQKCHRGPQSMSQVRLVRPLLYGIE